MHVMAKFVYSNMYEALIYSSQIKADVVLTNTYNNVIHYQTMRMIVSSFLKAPGNIRGLSGCFCPLFRLEIYSCSWYGSTK